LTIGLRDNYGFLAPFGLPKWDNKTIDLGLYCWRNWIVGIAAKYDNKYL